MDANGSQKSIAVAYAERGDRWMEKQEAKSLRIALEDIDLLEEQKIHNAAHDEATELVRQHQDPEAHWDSFAPYDYRAHLRKGSYASPTSVEQYESTAGGLRVKSTGSAPSESLSKYSEHSVSQDGYCMLQSGQVMSQNIHEALQDKGNVSQDSRDVFQSAWDKSQANLKLSSSTQSPNNSSTRPRLSSSGKSAAMEITQKQAGLPRAQKNQNLEFSVSEFKPLARRRISSPRRVSGGINLGPFKNPDDKIYEEPESLSAVPSASRFEETKPEPLVIKSRNVSGGKVPNNDLTVSKMLARHELHKNPPSQSRDPSYTQNKPKSSATIASFEDPKVPKRNGLEIRSEEIRAATSLKLKDRSPKLPIPSTVSNRPGRPIVSFDPNYQAKQEHLKQDKSALPPRNGARLVKALPTLPSKPSMPASTMSMPVIPTINVPEQPRIETNNIPEIEVSDYLPAAETKNTPITNFNGSTSKPGTSVQAEFIIPSIDVSEPSRVSVLDHQIPTIITSENDCSNHHLSPLSHNSTKPTSVGSFCPLSYHSITTPLPLPRSHWTPTSLRATAQCSACALPIAGRIVSAASQRFHPACFSCFACGELLECVAFYPEPNTFRSSRLARIEARLNGLPLPEAEIHVSEQEDGDDSLRFYCHLDFHEKYSPRCRSCKTPIEGEVVVACGGEWHVGHFFCAECGDPFDSNTPFVEKDGYAWCVGCHSRRFNGKCAGCRKAIEEVVVKALGREWHEACFCCKVCALYSRHNRA